MAKIGFTKLGLKQNNEIVEVYFNEQMIEVKQYLPVEEKLELITSVLKLSHDQNNFSNPIKIQVYTALEMVEKYTNINFTDKQKENPTKLYDLLNGNGLLEKIINAIPQAEYDELIKGIYDTVDAVYSYENSVLGILNAISKDYEDTSFDISKLQEEIANPENITLLKNIINKLG